MKSNKAIYSSNEDIQICIYSQTIQPNHKPKGKIPNIIKTQRNSTKSKKQAMEQEEDTT